MNQLAPLQPLAISPEDAAHASGTTRSAIYEAIARGDQTTGDAAGNVATLQRQLAEQRPSGPARSGANERRPAGS